MRMIVCVYTSLTCTLICTLLYIGHEPPPAGHSRGAGRRREDRTV